MNPLRIGVLGCAGIARRRMLPAMAAVPEVLTVTAVAGRDPQRTARTAGEFGCAPVHGYAALLERDDVDAVYVPLPLALHDEWTRAALLAGKHVLAEKPLTGDPERTRSLLQLAAERGLVLRENVMFVHHGQHTEVRKLVAEGAIGQLRSLYAVFTVPAPPDGDIRYRPELGGGALWDIGLYPVRAALHFLGPELSVVGAVLERSRGRSVDTAGAALLRTPEGALAQLEFGMDHGYRSGYELCGSEGRITVDRAFTPPAGHRPVLRVVRGVGPEARELDAEDQVARTVVAFAQAVRAGALTPLDDIAVRQAELLAEIRRAAWPADRG
ncbi:MULTISPECIES: Gfo/Idh/MocA family oxidoreductase [unclassified Streptomyces]|uniref:Gfo/Idh/MocA family protein n=1 Tax=unclassified Streptomyces TaxID=2593676 RepID=UPI0027D9E603|nr:MULTISPECIES: Gfo/Idh/MocA family oxidoreductase [unclassified Streptomyces]